MAITSGFFNSVNRDRIYKADFFAEYFASFIANGVFPNPSTGMQVIANGNMTVSIRAGKAWIKGYYVNNDADYLLSLGVADGVLKRIDRIVLRLDFSSRQITPVVKKGTSASSPTAPSLQRDADAYELGLADVLITNGAISISQANITDNRLNIALCGIVHGVVDQVDTTTIFNQYQAWFNEFSIANQSEFNAWKSEQESDYTNWSAAKKNEFDSWFTSIQDILSGDVAGNLLSKINQIESDLAAHKAEDATLAGKGHVQLSDDANSDNSVMAATPNAVRKMVEQNSYNLSKSNKDPNGIFTTVQHIRKSDRKLVRKSVLSGGTSPQYTTRTVSYYKKDGITVEKTETFTLSYDADGDLVDEV